MEEVTVTFTRREAEALGFPLTQPSYETGNEVEDARDKIRTELFKLYRDVKGDGSPSPVEHS